LALRLTTDAPISYLAEEVPFVLEGPVNLILGPDERITAPIAATTPEYFELTQDYWFEWTRYLSVPFEWQDAVIRAAIVLDARYLDRRNSHFGDLGRANAGR
jgi:hypothetical protein